MHERPFAVAMGVLLAVLVALLYPALALERAVAPEVSLRGRAPWRVQWGPFPAPLPVQVQAATELGARLSLLKRDLAGVALWNPWIGGGRPGWLASAREGGTPLVMLAVLLARQGWTWTALLALQFVAAFLSTAWLLRRLGLGAWPAALGACCYALAGPMASHWLDWHGPALALAPLGVALTLPQRSSWVRLALGWGAALTLFGTTGTPALPFIALALALATAPARTAELPRRLAAVVIGASLAAAVLAPRLWLAAAGREPGATGVEAAVEAPLPSLRTLAFPPLRFDPAMAAEKQAAADARGFLGLATLALAVVGLFVTPRWERAVWGGTLCASLALAFAPPGWLSQLGMSQRPLAVAALAAAALAAYGFDRLTRGLALRRKALAGTGTVAVIVYSLLPVAVRHVPFVPPEEGVLPAPLEPAASPAEPRILGLLGCLPPDVGAAGGRADVRASFFHGEPRYVKALGAEVSGAFSVARALTPEMAALGVGILLEPLPLRVVSSEIYSHIDVEELPVGGERSTARPISFTVSPTTTRLGVARGVRLAGKPTLRLAGRQHTLRDDPTLASESEQWLWFALPKLERDTDIELALAPTVPPLLPLALDRSGLRVVKESSGVRVWQWERGVPFASLVWPLGEESKSGSCPGFATVQVAQNSYVSVAVRDSGSCWLRLHIKYRPALWHAKVAGQPAQMFRCQEVWTCVPVPAGGATVELAAGVPWEVVALSLIGCTALAGLAWRVRRA